MDKGTKIGNYCPMCGKYSEKILNVTQEQAEKYYNREECILWMY